MQPCSVHVYNVYIEGSDLNQPARETIRAGSVGSSHGRAQNHNDNLIIPTPGPTTTPSHDLIYVLTVLHGAI